MKIRFLLLCSLFMTLHAMAQQASLANAYTFGGVGNQIVNDIAIDNAGNVLLTGNYFAGNPNDFNPGPEVDSLAADLTSNGFITKWSSDGVFQWSVPIMTSASGSSLANDECTAITTDSQGNVIVTGFFGSTVDFDPGVNEFLLVANSSAGVQFVLKLSSEGEFLWAFKVDANIFYPTQGMSLAVDSEDNVIVGSIFSEAPDFDPGPEVHLLGTVGLMDCAISKYNADGEFIWAKSFGSGATDLLFDLTVDEFDNIYTTGYLGASADVDPGVEITEHLILGSVDAYIHKLNPDGEFVWFVPVAGIGNDQSFGIDYGIDGSIAVTGGFNGSIDLDTTVAEYFIEPPGGGWGGTFIVSYDTTGALNWGRSMMGFSSEGDDVAIDDFGNVLVAGHYLGTMDFDPELSEPVYTSFGDQDPYMVKLNNQGQFLSGAGWGSAGDDRSTSIKVGSDNLALVAGYFGGVADFDPTPLVSSVSSDGLDCFLVRLNTCNNEALQLYETACESYTYNNVTYTESGSYEHAYLTSTGCDSIVTLNLTIPVVPQVSIEEVACETFTYNETTYTQSGNYIHVFMGSNGCDSLVILNLTIPVIPETTLNETACELFILNDQVYTESGIYTQTIPSSSGCDSIINLNLTIPVIVNDVQVDGNTISALQQDASYQWIDCNLKGAEIDGATSVSFTPEVSGSFAVEITTGGCTVESDCEDLTIDFVASQEGSSFSIYPVPATEQIVIELMGLQIERTEIRNMQNQLIISKTSSSGSKLNLDISSLTTGVYHVLVYSGDEMYHRSIVVN